MKLDESMSAVITGGGSGLGEATARRLSAAGVRVLLLDRDADKAKELAREVGCSWAVADITDEEQVEAAVGQAAGLGDLRILVNCAGIARGQTRTLNRDGSTHDQRDWAHVVTVNLVGTYNVSRIFSVHAAKTAPLDDGARGAIVMTASCAAHEGQTGQTAYAAAKAGVVGLTLPLARDLQAVGIRVNTISPGMFDTPMWPDHATVPDAAIETEKRLYEDLLFPRRMGAPDEYASLAMELIGNGYLNGEVFRIDGGLRMRAK